MQGRQEGKKVGREERKGGKKRKGREERKGEKRKGGTFFKLHFQYFYCCFEL